jgi:hypothetical protein
MWVEALKKDTKNIPVMIVDFWTEVGVRYLKCSPFVVRTVDQHICSVSKMYAFGNVETVVLIQVVSLPEYLEKYKPRKLNTHSCIAVVRHSMLLIKRSVYPY